MSKISSNLIRLREDLSQPGLSSAEQEAMIASSGLSRSGKIRERSRLKLPLRGMGRPRLNPKQEKPEKKPRAAAAVPHFVSDGTDNPGITSTEGGRRLWSHLRGIREKKGDEELNRELLRRFRDLS